MEISYVNGSKTENNNIEHRIELSSQKTRCNKYLVALHENASLSQHLELRCVGYVKAFAKIFRNLETYACATESRE